MVFADSIAKRRVGKTGLFKQFLALGLLAGLTIVVYFPSLHYSFLNYDDDEYVTANANVRSGLNLASLKWAFENRDAGHWQPITWISHQVDCTLYGLNAARHHLDSLVFHVANVCLLFLLLQWLTGASEKSLFVAAIFAVHPANVESVVWIAERKTLVCTLFHLSHVCRVCLVYAAPARGTLSSCARGVLLGGYVEVHGSHRAFVAAAA